MQASGELEGAAGSWSRTYVSLKAGCRRLSAGELPPFKGAAAGGGEVAAAEPVSGRIRDLKAALKSRNRAVIGTNHKFAASLVALYLLPCNGMAQETRAVRAPEIRTASQVSGLSIVKLTHLPPSSGDKGDRTDTARIT